MYDEEVRRKENDRGCVLKVSTAGASALLAGDVESRAEAQMLARDPQALRAQVLVVPHHGSRTSSTPAFVAAVAPEIAIFSVGYRNRFHHPHPAIVQRYAAAGAQLRRTDREGALHVELPAREGHAIAVRAYAGQRHYWSDHEPAHLPPAGELRGDGPARVDAGARR